MPIPKDRHFYITLFKTMFSLSAFTFGGGYVIISLMKKRFIEDLKWITEEEMLDMTAIAQSSPGAIAVNTSIILGYHLDGLKGALIAVIGTALPPLIILSFVSILYTQIIDQPLVIATLKAMQAGVSVVLIDVIYTSISHIIKRKHRLEIIIMISSFILVYFFKFNVMLMIVLGAFMGLIFFRKNGVIERDLS